MDRYCPLIRLHIIASGLLLTLGTQPVCCYYVDIVVTLGTQPVGCYTEVVCSYSGTCT